MSLLALAVTVTRSTIDQPKKWSTEDEGGCITLVKNASGPILGFPSNRSLNDAYILCVVYDPILYIT
jgi:hypothetical protein